MNEVDTTQETIDLEFDAVAEAIGVAPEQPTDVAPSPEELAAQQEAEQQAQIVIAQQMINTSLRMGLGLFMNVSVDNQHTEDAAKAYAVLIIKYFPGGIFGLIDRYKEELGAVTATVMLIGVVNQAKAKQAEALALEQAKEDAKAKQPQEKKSVETTPSETGPFVFGEQTESPKGVYAHV